MKIPSPRPFFETLAFIIFGIFVCVSMSIAWLLLLMILVAEKVFERVQGLKMRRRA